MHIQKTKNIRNGKYVVQVYSFIIFKKDNCLKQKVIYLGYNQVELKYTINEGWDKWEDITIWWRRQWHPTLVLSPGESHGRRSLVGCSPWGR